MSKLVLVKFRLSDYFTPSGRYNRWSYFIYSLVALVGFFIAIGLFTSIQDLNLITFNELGTKIFEITYTLALTLWTYIIYSLTGKRLHDLGHSAAWGIIYLLDLALQNITQMYGIFFELPTEISQGIEIMSKFWIVFNLAGLYLTFGRGKSGKNKYGPDPLRARETEVDVF